MHLVPPEMHTPSGVLKHLAGRGAPNVCYVFAEGPAPDGRCLPLDEALCSTIGRGMGTILSCVPGRLAYYEGEYARDQYVLERPRSSATLFRGVTVLVVLRA